MIKCKVCDVYVVCVYGLVQSIDDVWFVVVGGVEYMCVDFGVDVDVFDLDEMWFVIVKDSVCN